MAEENKKDKGAKKNDKKAQNLEKELADLRKELDELKQSSEEKIAKEKEDYLRLMAEFETFRRRSAEDRLALVSSAAEDTVKGLLPILDDFERALSALSDTPDGDAAKEGTHLIYNKLFAYLKSKGLEVIEAKGQVFDTDFHEAVAQFPVQEEEQKGKVFDVVQTGYLYGGKVLRYAKVVVGV